MAGSTRNPEHRDAVFQLPSAGPKDVAIEAIFTNWSTRTDDGFGVRFLATEGILLYKRSGGWDRMNALRFKVPATPFGENTDIWRRVWPRELMAGPPVRGPGQDDAHVRVNRIGAAKRGAAGN